MEGKWAGGTEQVTGTEWHKLPGIKPVESGDAKRSVGSQRTVCADVERRHGDRTHHREQKR